MYDVFLRPVIQRIHLQPESTFIVEYGSGMGRILKAVKAAGFECAGIDISSTMIEYSRQLVPEVSRLSVLDKHGHCDIPTASADFVYSYATIQHITRLSRVQIAIKEMCRILKPGGILKFQFLARSFPFKKIFRGGNGVYNFESKSLLIDSRRLFSPKLYTHTNWIGVPLSYRNLQKFLDNGGVRLLGIEEDVGHKKMMWVLARKEK